MRNCVVALMQEPWTYEGEIKGLKKVDGEQIYSRFNPYPKNCVLGKNGFQILLLMNRCSSELTAVKTKSSSEGDGGDYSRIGITPIR
jgi:hypothetical protein